MTKVLLYNIWQDFFINDTVDKSPQQHYNNIEVIP